MLLNQTLTYYTFDSLNQSFTMTQSLLAQPLKQLTIPDSYHDFQATEAYKQLPAKIQQLFEHLEQITQNSNENGFIQGQSELYKGNASIQSEHFTLCNSFKRMSNREQTLFMQELICELKLKLKGASSQPNQAQIVQQYQCSIRLNSYCVPHWIYILLKLNKNRKTLTLPFHERTIDVYLRECLLRRSKAYQLCFVLQNIGFAAKNKQYVYHIKFEEKDRHSFQQLQSSIKRIIVQSQIDYLFRQIKQQKNVKAALSKGRGQISLFLTQKNIRRFNQIQYYFDQENHESNIVKQSERFSDQASVKASLENQSYTQVSSSESCKMQVSKNDEKLYRLKYHLKEIPSILIKNFIDCYKANHKFVFRLKVIQSKQEKIPQGLMKYAAFYQKIVWNQKIYDQTFILKHQGSDQQDQNMNLQAFKVSIINIDHRNNKNFIQFMQITLKETSKIDVQAKILVKFTRGFDNQAIKIYLLKFLDVFQGRKNVGSSVYGSVLKTKPFQNLFPEYGTQKLEKSEIIQAKKKSIINLAQKQQSKKNLNNQIDLLFSDNFDKKKDSQPKRVLIDESYLKYKYPLGVVNKKGKIMKEHFLWTNWKRAEKGGLVCKNEQLVERQKKMFKLVIKKFGQTLLMGKNIINFSLPVVVFKKESHLQSLAKSYLYSPIFTERAASIPDPLQRMKFSVVLMITQNALSIHMQKPFNPILGETYQGWINGCPMYLQQISHHPPISAYYFLGRGYKKYGCIEPKISVGLNNASGYSIFPHFVQFDDGMKIEYICAKIMIGGLLIGERTFNFEDKIYAYDRKHRYFASVKFGPTKKGFFSSSNQPQDYFWGEIYEVSPQFEQYFDQQKGIKPHPQQRHIIKKLSNFDGIWNSFVKINGEEVLNFQTDLPYQFQQQEMPLPSDSIYRDDLSNLLSGDLQAAQIAKEEMEEIQRRDRRLREEHQNS